MMVQRAVEIRNQPLQTLHWPDALPLVLAELETALALGIADVAAARLYVQKATGSAKPPGGMLHVLPNLRFSFADAHVRQSSGVAGEMIDWEAPTGGYLLQASFATGAAAGRAAARWTDAGRQVIEV